MGKISTRTIALATLASFIPAIAAAMPRVPAPKSIYGEDNRQDYFAASPAEKRLAGSVASLWKSYYLEPEGGGFRLLTSSLGERLNLCPGEKFSEQPIGADCSGSLVGKDILMTAGHCIRTEQDCADTKIVFGFAITRSGGNAPEVIPGKDVYGCKEIISRTLQGGGPDYALIRLDRASDRAPLKINREDSIKPGDGVFVIGHPIGLPLKVSGGSHVRDASNSGFFVADLDTFGGNSGSPVFNSATNAIEGILVRGAADFADTPEQCTTMATYTQNGGRGEDVTKLSVLESFIPGGDASSDRPIFRGIDANYMNETGAEPGIGDIHFQ